MEHRSGAELVEGGRERRSVGDVDLGEAHAGRQPVGVAGREVVDHEYLVAVSHERVHDVRADEARPTGHERPLRHHASLRRAGKTT